MAITDPSSILSADESHAYAGSLAELKATIQATRRRTVVNLNSELVQLYWLIGKQILERQTAQAWGSNVLDRLARDLRTAFPEMKGLSRANLMYRRSFAQVWPDPQFVQQLVGQLSRGANLRPANPTPNGPGVTKCLALSQTRRQFLGGAIATTILPDMARRIDVYPDPSTLMQRNSRRSIKRRMANPPQYSGDQPAVGLPKDNPKRLTPRRCQHNGAFCTL